MLIAMNDKRMRVQVFLASPGELSVERRAMEEIVKSLQVAIGDPNEFDIVLKKWETHAWPGFGLYPQEVINNQVGSYDIFVGMMWNRIGSPTPSAKSGTVEEFQKAYELWKEHKRPSLMFYFNNAPACFETEEDCDQKKEVIRFKKTLGDLEGLYAQYEGGEEFRQMAFQHLSKEILSWSGDKRKDNDQRQSIRSENLCDPNHWPQLTHLGEWRLEKTDSCIHGAGVYAFLLSKREFGRRPFRITATLTFDNYSQFVGAVHETANAGIVFSWNEANGVHRYHNLLFTGDRIVLERVGFDGGDDYRDFVHMDSGAPLTITDRQPVRFAISCSERFVEVFVDNKMVYSTAKPRSFEGHVGLRPWRSQMVCSHFQVTEL